MILAWVLLTVTTTINCGQSVKLTTYNGFFDKIRATMEDDKDDKAVLTRFEQDFYMFYSNKKNTISSSSLDLDVSTEINTLVNAFKFDQKLGTYAYGTETNDQFIKILISGAKGTKSSAGSKQISTLALSEIVELNQTANAIAYAARIGTSDYIIDAKVDEAEGKPAVNDKGQYIVCKSVGKRYVLDSLKSSLAITKMYRLAIGSDYAKFEINLLIAGAAVKDDSVVSKSSIKVMAYIITSGDSKVKTNMGLFTSENKTNDQKSVSTHFGFLRVQKAKDLDTQKTESSVSADANGTNASAYFLDFLNSIKTK